MDETTGVNNVENGAETPIVVTSAVPTPLESSTGPEIGGEITIPIIPQETPEPAKMGRPSDYTKELGDKICEELATGKSMRTVCKEDEMPSMQTVFSWLRKFPDFLEQYEQAKEQSTVFAIEELEEMGDEAIALAQKVDPKASNAVVSAYKLKADNKKWAMSKLRPKKYGDKLDVTSKGEQIKGNTIVFSDFKEKLPPVPAELILPEQNLLQEGTPKT